MGIGVYDGLKSTVVTGSVITDLNPKSVKSEFADMGNKKSPLIL